MKYLIAGLGNIGEEYENTRHNIGFKALDFLIKESSVSFGSDRYATVAYFKLKGRTLVLIKPTTFMNLSGKAVNYWLQKESIPLDNLLVVTDDLALPFGSVRMKSKGSDGGHNGLKNINEVLGRSDYARLRFGIGNNFSKGKQVDYVLHPWSAEETSALPERLEHSCQMIQAFATIGVDRAMSSYNNK
jgi:PTH1 family peptidyl-tRNA hydrolase